jgi:hypothetical protein
MSPHPSLPPSRPADVQENIGEKILLFLGYGGEKYKNVIDP